VRTELVERIGEIAMGTPVDFRNFMAAVIDRPSFTRIASFLEEARGNGYEILAGGVADEAEGYFVQPTLVLSEDPKSRLMREEIFGPLLTIFVYEDASFEETLALCDATSPYALTGAIFANDRRVIERMSERLRFAAGNFYINDKPTGAVVGQQPFGGGRASGTNDKAGSSLNLSRWMSMRAIKETLVPATSYRYPHMEESRCE
jgi:1-pyrroline-5-carboxylate dehydrogenase